MEKKPVVQKNHLFFLDGLRALAALWVVLGHSHLFGLGWNVSTSIIGKPLDVLLYMHLGVNIFLVLSGFCLALPVVRNGNVMRTTLLAYFQARAWRILLPYYAVLLLILLVNYFIPIIHMARAPLGLTSEIPANVLWTNFLLLQDFFPGLNQINGPFWSIATEWHLYFVFPAAIWLLRRHGPLALTLAAACIAAGMTYLYAVHPVLIHTTVADVSVPIPAYFILLFAMGMAAASLAYDPAYADQRALIQRYAKVGGVVLLVPLAYVLWINRIINGDNVGLFLDHLYVIDPLAGGAFAAFLLVLSGVRPDNRLRTFLEWKPLVAIGGFSYSLYLVHIPILAFVYSSIDGATTRIGLGPLSPMQQFWIVVIVGAGASIAFARIFGRVFERRYRIPWQGKPLQSPGAFQ